MNRNQIVFLAAVSAGCAAVVFTAWTAEETVGQTGAAAKPRFTISRETTFFTEPVRADGSIDFVTAINRKFGKGVKPCLLYTSPSPRDS